MDNEIRTFTGLLLSLADPQPEQICITDIAVGLSRENRWSNQSRKPFKVAEHSVIMARLYTANPLYALLHDATEAYIHDIACPAKMMLPDYCAMEARLWGAIAARFGLPEAHPEDFKALEQWHVEREHAYISLRPNDPGFLMQEEMFHCMPEDIAYTHFVNEYKKITGVTEL